MEERKRERAKREGKNVFLCDVSVAAGGHIVLYLRRSAVE
jgi:hypothetical protein